MNLLEQFRDVRTIILDVDGVLTNNELIITEDGELLRTMNARDGFAMKQAIISGYHLAIITGGSSKGVISRLQGLGVKDIYTGVHNKLEVFNELVDIHLF